jgi:hypothetical protein
MRRPAPKKKLDALILLAKASGGRRRRQTVVGLLVCLALALACGGLLVFWIWPEPRLGRPNLAVFDTLAHPDEPARLIARLEPSDPQVQGVRLSGLPVSFEEATSGLSAQVATDRSGVATCEGTFPLAPQPLEVAAGYPGDARRGQRGAQGRGRVFVWPADKTLVVVDADSALTAADSGQFQTTNNLDVKPLPGAVAAVRGLAAKYAIVYLTGTARQAAPYIKLRAWLDGGFVPGQQLPAGPVLTACAEADAAAARRSVLAALKGRFAGKALGVTADAEVAAEYRQEGLETFLIGGGENGPEGVTSVADWEALAKKLTPQ